MGWGQGGRDTDCSDNIAINVPFICQCVWWGIPPSRDLCNKEDIMFDIYEYY